MLIARLVTPPPPYYNSSEEIPPTPQESISSSLPDSEPPPYDREPPPYVCYPNTPPPIYFRVADEQLILTVPDPISTQASTSQKFCSVLRSFLKIHAGDSLPVKMCKTATWVTIGSAGFSIVGAVSAAGSSAALGLTASNTALATALGGISGCLLGSTCGAVTAYCSHPRRENLCNSSADHRQTQDGFYTSYQDQEDDEYVTMMMAGALNV